MTEKKGKYYCDICHDATPIEKGKGFNFPPNPLGIEHAHQTCYNSYYDMGKEVTKGMTKTDIEKLSVEWNRE